MLPFVNYDKNEMIVSLIVLYILALNSSQRKPIHRRYHHVHRSFLKKVNFIVGYDWFRLYVH